MTLGPYTYITLAMHEGQTPSLEISFHTAALWVRGHVIKDERPYMSIGTPDATVSITTTGGGSVTDADLTTAREIATVAAQYLADCERMHATHQAATSGEAA